MPAAIHGGRAVFHRQRAAQDCQTASVVFETQAADFTKNTGSPHRNPVFFICLILAEQALRPVKGPLVPGIRLQLRTVLVTLI